MNFLGRSGSPYLTHYPTHIAHRREGQKNRENSSCQSTISIAFSLCLNWDTQLHLWLKHDFATWQAGSTTSQDNLLLGPQPSLRSGQVPRTRAAGQQPMTTESPEDWWHMVTSSRIHTDENWEFAKLMIYWKQQEWEYHRIGIWCVLFKRAGHKNQPKLVIVDRETQGFGVPYLL